MAKRVLETGRIALTRGVFDATSGNEPFTRFVCESLARHTMGDWGDVCEEDKQSNNEALKCGDRILSAYDYAANPDLNIWIITEYDRSVTTVLFPREY